MTTLKTMAATLLLLIAPLTQAHIIDFVELTEGTNQLGESAWSTLSVN